MKHAEGDVLCWVVSLKRVDQLRSGLQNADILADSRNKGTFDSKSRKKGNTWTEIAFARQRNIFLLRSFDILWDSPVLT